MIGLMLVYVDVLFTCDAVLIFGELGSSKKSVWNLETATLAIFIDGNVKKYWYLELPVYVVILQKQKGSI